jgi:hypothetical protein
LELELKDLHFLGALYSLALLDDPPCLLLWVAASEWTINKITIAVVVVAMAIGIKRYMIYD